MGEAGENRALTPYKDLVYRELIRFAHEMPGSDLSLADAILIAFKRCTAGKSPDEIDKWLLHLVHHIRLNDVIQRSLARFLSSAQLRSLGFGAEGTEFTLSFEPDYERLIGYSKDLVIGLPEINRSVYWMREIKYVSVEAVCKQLNITPAALKSRLARSRQLVRATMDDFLE